VRPEKTVTKPRLSWAFIFDGLRFTLKTPALLALVLLDTVTMVLGFYPAMMPVFARDVLQVGASGLGLLMAAPAFGAMLGFVGILLLGNIRKKGVVILAVTLGHAIVLFAFSQATWLPAAVVLVALLGLLDSMSMTVRSTSFSELAPDHVRGRVMSVLYISAVSANSLGGAYLGFATAALGPRDALGTGAIVAGVFTLLVAVFWKKVRQM
jgi:MFS family permease